MSTQVTINIRLLEDRSDIRVIDLSGEIDESNLKDLEKQVSPFIEDENVLYIIFNLKDLSYINSKVIGYFASYYSELTNKDKKMFFRKNIPLDRTCYIELG